MILESFLMLKTQKVSEIYPEREEMKNEEYDKESDVKDCTSKGEEESYEKIEGKTERLDKELSNDCESIDKDMKSAEENVDHKNNIEIESNKSDNATVGGSLVVSKGDEKRKKII